MAIEFQNENYCIFQTGHENVLFASGQQYHNKQATTNKLFNWKGNFLVFLFKGQHNQHIPYEFLYIWPQFTGSSSITIVFQLEVFSNCHNIFYWDPFKSNYFLPLC